MLCMWPYASVAQGRAGDSNYQRECCPSSRSSLHVWNIELRTMLLPVLTKHAQFSAWQDQLFSCPYSHMTKMTVFGLTAHTLDWEPIAPTFKNLRVRVLGVLWPFCGHPFWRTWSGMMHCIQTSLWKPIMSTKRSTTKQTSSEQTHPKTKQRFVNICLSKDDT